MQSPAASIQANSTATPNATSGAAPIYHFKVLVPAAAAGRIIGKGGNAIVQLQKDAGARIKLSKASEFYPGTTERVCLISGPIEGILKIIESIVKSLTPDHLSRPTVSSTPPNNNLNNSTSINGNHNHTIHPNNNHSSQNNSILNGLNNSITTYGQLIPSSSSSVSPPSIATHHLNRPSNSLTPPVSIANSALASNINIGSSSSTSNRSLTPVGRPISPASTGVTSDMNAAQIIETIKLVLRVSGYGEDAVSEISSGMSTLASYGVLGVGLGLL